MPLSIAQILDLLMALIIVMFVPIGLWRGALREWMAFGGILLGSALATEWAYGLGGDLATQAALDPRVARFTVASLLFIAVTLVIGYGAGVALPFRPDLSWPNRLLGALLGLGNGMLVLSGALRIMQHYLFDDAATSPLLGSLLASYLIGSIGWTFLGLTLVLVITIVAALLRRWGGRPALLDEFVPVFYPDEYVAEEAAEWSGTPEGEEEDVAQRTPIPASSAAPLPAVAWADEQARARNALATQQTDVFRPAATPVVVREIVEVPPPAPSEDTVVPLDATPPTATRRVIDLARPLSPVAPTEAPSPNGAAREPAIPPVVEAAANGVGAAEETACAVCGASARPESRFCASCGHIRGEAERRAIQLKGSA